MIPLHTDYLQRHHRTNMLMVAMRGCLKAEHLVGSKAEMAEKMVVPMDCCSELNMAAC